MQKETRWSEAERQALRETLGAWYKENHRDFPWRKTDAWGRLVSEAMLIQTQTSTVLPYYEHFMERFPEPLVLAEASEDDVLKAWEGLGYYRRAKNLKKAAEQIVQDYQGEVPRDYASLHELAGVGDYTAGALASFLSGARTPAIDGNVWRVMCRLLGEDFKRNRVAERRIVAAAIEEILGTDTPEIEVDAGLINEAMIELGALVCKPKGDAECALCPWNAACVANKEGLVAFIPSKNKQKTNPSFQWTVPIIKNGKEEYLIHERSEGLLQGLYEFPMLEGTWSKEGKKETLLSKDQTHLPIEN